MKTYAPNETDAGAPKRTRIQARNEQKILEAALAAFASQGFHGATVERIAEQADMSQPNLHRYFPTKLALYRAVLGRILASWFEPLAALDPDEEPGPALRRYIARKLELARTEPEASRVFAHELLQGAPHLQEELRGIVAPNASRFAQTVGKWVDAGQLRPVDPAHLLFLLWSSTQHYADFAPQVAAVLGKSRISKQDYAVAETTLCDVLLAGLLPHPR